MKETTVDILSVRQHPDYIRGKHSKQYVSELVQILTDAGKWPFPPAILQPMPSDSPDEKLKKEIESGARYWILDGTHRIAAAVESGMKTIPAKISEPMTSLDAIATQIQTNNAHGLRLSAEHQTAAIKKLSELGMKGKMIAEKTGLSAASISRIVSDKQRDASNPDAKRGGTSEQKIQAKQKPFNAEIWMKGLARSLKAWEKFGGKIRKAGFPDVCQKAMDTLAENLLHGEE